MTKTKTKSTTGKKIPDMSKAEYQAYVRRLEKRHGPDKTWADLPIIRRPGRPAKGTKVRPLQPRSVKLPQTVWKTLASAAKRHGVTASGVVAGLALQATAQEGIDRAIDQLIEQGVETKGQAFSCLHPTPPNHPAVPAPPW